MKLEDQKKCRKKEQNQIEEKGRTQKRIRIEEQKRKKNRRIRGQQIRMEQKNKRQEDYKRRRIDEYKNIIKSLSFHNFAN